MTPHSHDHSHVPAGGVADHRGRLWFVFILTSIVVLAQAIGAAVTGSLALLTDTAHALTDATGILIALIAATLMVRPASSSRTWGFRRIEVIVAFCQSGLLIGVGLFTAIEAVRRLFAPPEIPATELLIFGVVGLAANVVSIVVLSSARAANFNMRAAFLEVLNDALGSVAIIVAAIVIATTGFQRADAITSLFIAALIVPRAFRLMRETAAVLMEFTPPGLNLDDVREHILALDHVIDVHDLHASTVATGLPRLSAHVVVSDECFTDGHAARMLDAIRTCVAEHHGVSINHATIQIESEGHSTCAASCLRESAPTLGHHH